MKRLIIEQLKEGFLLGDNNGDRYGMCSAELLEWIKNYFEMVDSIIPEAPPVTISEATKPETQGNKTPDSHSGGATSSHHGADNQTTPHKAVSSGALRVGEGEKHDDVSNHQDVLGVHLDDIVIHSSDLKIPKFKYDESKMQSYKNIFFQEMPDGTVVLEYDKSHYYTTKENILKIPYPPFRKYFSKHNGWSSSIEIAFKKYRKYLAELPQRQQVEKGKPVAQHEGPDDWKYKPLLSVNTRTDYDGNKIEGSLEE